MLPAVFAKKQTRSVVRARNVPDHLILSINSWSYHDFLVSCTPATTSVTDAPNVSVIEPIIPNWFLKGVRGASTSTGVVCWWWNTLGPGWSVPRLVPYNIGHPIRGWHPKTRKDVQILRFPKIDKKTNHWPDVGPPGKNLHRFSCYPTQKALKSCKLFV